MSSVHDVTLAFDCERGLRAPKGWTWCPEAQAWIYSLGEHEHPIVVRFVEVGRWSLEPNRVTGYRPLPAGSALAGIQRVMDVLLSEALAPVEVACA